MPSELASNPAAGYHKSVFLNCPFDGSYKPLFHAAVFTVLYCGRDPRCALEISNSAQVRIEKIFTLIESCQFGIHDISRTELDTGSGLPRFNMSLELGIFLGAQRFGVDHHKNKNCLILDREPYRYQQFMSDISGQDIAAHGADSMTLITKVRDWLNAAADAAHPLPSGSSIAQEFVEFQADTPDICKTLRLVPQELTFLDFRHVVRFWLTTPGVSLPINPVTQ